MPELYCGSEEINVMNYIVADGRVESSPAHRAGNDAESGVHRDAFSRRFSRPTKFNDPRIIAYGTGAHPQPEFRAFVACLS